MIGLTLIYRRLRGGNRRLGRYAVRGLNPALILWGMLLMAATNVVLEPLLQLLPEIPDFYGRGWRALLLTVVMAPPKSSSAGAFCSTPPAPRAARLTDCSFRRSFSA